ncbi:ComEC/Rec2 family competence protein [Flavobacterium aquicola]|uniref:Competence protein ComEC n=1 Tax=Flavobacterium aquicola TaxID=1682742 RepID=A0A3E0EG25_9FLAO|nr:ComEC/Rec2 family competence protein [Flavobacterium aquicola]REG96229.1 competence protein ComEC [Flavobacterium aquicola]
MNASVSLLRASISLKWSSNSLIRASDSLINASEHVLDASDSQSHSSDNMTSTSEGYNHNYKKDFISYKIFVLCNMKVLQFPLARITIAFITGILSAYSLKPSLSIVFIFICITILIFTGTYYSSRRDKKFQLYFGLAVYLLAFSIGATTQSVHTNSNQQSNYIHYKNIFDKNHTFTLTLREKLKNTAFNERYTAQLNSIDNEKTSGSILLNIRKDSLSHHFIIGNQLKINALLNRNTAQKNPNQFDYSKYLENKQIYAQLYADANEIQIGSIIEKDIWYYTAAFRSRIIQNLEKSHFQTKELNVAIALIMGQQQDIDPEITKDYQYAGAVHILSVSGLHIGFILLFVTLLLKPFPNTKKGLFIKLLIILLSLWLFGVLAGLAPSVVRSVTMFSFVAIGQHLKRSTNIYHTLLVSVLLILLFQPSFLFDVGFQLSYTALFFIIWLQPLFANLWKPKNKIVSYFWDILTVSFAAQIGTLPLSIYYFHQFPGLFFVTNLIVIPFLGFIMSLGVVVMLLAACSWVPYYPAKTLELSIYYLDRIISFIASLEQFIVRDIPLNTSILISGYLAIITLIIAFEHKNTKSIFGVLTAVVLLQLSCITTKWEIQNQAEFIVLNTSKKTQLIERNGSIANVYANDSISGNIRNNAVLSSYLTANFSSLNQQSKLKNVFFFKGNKILLIDSSMVYPRTIHPDVVVLTQSPKLNLDRLITVLNPKIIVADASNYKSVQKRWAVSCKQQKIPFHSTNEKGFFQIN